MVYFHYWRLSSFTKGETSFNQEALVLNKADWAHLNPIKLAIRRSINSLTESGSLPDMIERLPVLVAQSTQSYTDFLLGSKPSWKALTASKEVNAILLCRPAGSGQDSIQASISGNPKLELQIISEFAHVAVHQLACMDPPSFSEQYTQEVVHRMVVGLKSLLVLPLMCSCTGEGHHLSLFLNLDLPSTSSLNQRESTRDDLDRSNGNSGKNGTRAMLQYLSDWDKLMAVCLELDASLGSFIDDRVNMQDTLDPLASCDLPKLRDTPHAWVDTIFQSPSNTTLIPMPLNCSPDPLLDLAFDCRIRLIEIVWRHLPSHPRTPFETFLSQFCLLSILQLLVLFCIELQTIESNDKDTEVDTGAIDPVSRFSDKNDPNYFNLMLDIYSRLLKLISHLFSSEQANRIDSKDLQVLPWSQDSSGLGKLIHSFYAQLSEDKPFPYQKSLLRLAEISSRLALDHLQVNFHSTEKVPMQLLKKTQSIFEVYKVTTGHLSTLGVFTNFSLIIQQWEEQIQAWILGGDQPMSSVVYRNKQKDHLEELTDELSLAITGKKRKASQGESVSIGQLFIPNQADKFDLSEYIDSRLNQCINRVQNAGPHGVEIIGKNHQQLLSIVKKCNDLAVLLLSRFSDPTSSPYHTN